MAVLNQGFFIARGSISTNTDTVIVTAQGLTDKPDHAAYLLWFTFTVSAAGTTSRLILQNGTGGAAIARMNTTTADALLNINYTTTYRDFPGNLCAGGISINTTGGAAATVDYEIAYQVK